MRGDITPKQLRSFGWLVGGVFALLGLWPMVFRSEGVRLWALVLAVLLIVPASVCPGSLKLPYTIWMVLGHALGWINTKIILGVVFYGLFTPVGLVMRMMGHDAMRRSFDPDADSYRIVSQPRLRSHMRQQF